jgi:hypothetical protein
MTVVDDGEALAQRVGFLHVVCGEEDSLARGALARGSNGRFRGPWKPLRGKSDSRLHSTGHQLYKVGRAGVR